MNTLLSLALVKIVVDILLNLKGVIFKLLDREEVTLTLNKSGEGVVTAADIELPHDVEILNPDHLIATLTEKAELKMQIKVEKGRGYVPGNVRTLKEDRQHTLGRIVLDASYSPIRRVSYEVENARVEQRTDLDKLVLDIETNGVVSAEEAVQSIRILMDQISVFAALESDPQEIEAPARGTPQIDPVLLRPVDEFRVS
ncbi:DNA-directed RNA polymerase subunit alpha [Oligella ureolytica]